MNIYGMVALLILILAVGEFFHLGPAIEQFANKIADIPSFEDKGSNPALYDLAVRMIYLISILGVFRIIFNRPKDGE